MEVAPGKEKPWPPAQGFFYCISAHACAVKQAEVNAFMQ
jgi:hypothetical protein